MSRVKLIFGTYNTLPSGETQEYYEQAYLSAFKPFLTAIYNNPGMCPTLYYSGNLLEWLDRYHPEFPTVLAELIGNKTVEILGGGYWEPLLPIIPPADRLGQIEMMTTYLRKRFGRRSRGCWITAQAWEPQIASTLSASGMDYLFLSERVFPSGSAVTGPVIAEDQGKTIVVFPVMSHKAERFLKDSPQQIVEALRQLTSSPSEEQVVSLMLPGLALGGNGTHGRSYKEKWLEQFFSEVAANQDWLEPVHPGRYLRSTHASRPKFYVPGTGYGTLMHWTRDSDAAKKTGKNDSAGPAALYREFLTKYRESGLLYSKMMYIVVLSNQLRGDKYRKRTAKEELWRGQEHYAYWHGPTGGLYNPALRHSAYGALIEAEKVTRERGIFKAAMISTDYDMDGEKEYLFNGGNYNAYVHLTGGALFELDYLPVACNYLATLPRYSEHYHGSEIQREGYDNHPRWAFLDHVLEAGEGPDFFEDQRSGSRFPGRRYEPVEVSSDKARLTLSCSEVLDGEPLEIRKTYQFKRNLLTVSYTLTNRGNRKLKVFWGPEINLALSGLPENRAVCLNTEKPTETLPSEKGTESDVLSWLVLDHERDVSIQFQLSEKAHLWRGTTFSASLMDGQLRSCYQSSCFLPYWELSLAPLEERHFQITLRIWRSKGR